MERVATWQAALLDAGQEAGIDALVGIVLEALEQELPVLCTDEDLKDAARSSSAANVALIIELVQEHIRLDEYESPPQAAAFVRELARRNVPVAQLARAYRVAEIALWHWAVDELRKRVPADRLARAVERLSEAAYATGDVFSRLVTERYAQERERWLRSADAVRAATLDELLAGGPVDTDAASRRLRYELRQEHQAFVVWADTESEEAVPEHAAAAVGGPRALLVPMGVGVVAGWCSVAAVAPEAANGGTSVALGSPASGKNGFRESHLEAMEARRVARLLGHQPGVLRYDDVALLSLLTKDMDQARAFARRTLGPLAHDDEASRRLADTLLVTLEEQGSPRRAARRLAVHENTVAKRLRNVEELLDGSPRRPAELLAALLILRAERRR
jgi:DNA-binding PucR family transcriptional regulator